jgi:hypothetical protein
MFKKIKNLLKGNLPNGKLSEIKSKDKIVLVKFPSKCLVCDEEMSSLRINQPLCDECLETLKVIIKKKKKKK